MLFEKRLCIVKLSQRTKFMLKQFINRISGLVILNFLREISNEHLIFLFILFRLNMDLDVIEFVPYCDVFLSGTSSSVF